MHNAQCTSTYIYTAAYKPFYVYVMETNVCMLRCLHLVA